MIALLFAPLPGLTVWLFNARMMRKLDDPAFDEKLWRYRIRVARVSGLALLALGLLAWPWMPVTVPLLWLCIWLAMYPLQRGVFGEERALGEYLVACLRAALGVTLFWLTVTFEPLIVGSIGFNNWGWVLAALIFWLYVYRSQMLWSLRATELIEPRFQAIVEKTNLRPTVWAIGSAKSSFVNAFALPDAKRPGVLMSRAMLRHLDADEASAIFAHEIAHLELWKRRRIAGWAFLMIIIIGAVLPGILNDAMFAQIVWIVAIGIGMLLRRSRRQQRETQCDLRAIELCGDPQALIRALTKTHRLSRIPVRWDKRYAKRATHPSLEQRIADITSRISHTSPGTADTGLAHSSAS